MRALVKSNSARLTGFLSHTSVPFREITQTAEKQEERCYTSKRKSRPFILQQQSVWQHRPSAHNRSPHGDTIDDSLMESEGSTTSDSVHFPDSHPITLELRKLDHLAPTETRVSKKRKKLTKVRQSKNDPCTETESVSMRSSEDILPEEFYDARESYHGLSENATSGAQAISQVRSDEGAPGYTIPVTSGRPAQSDTLIESSKNVI
ncbi:hypothetical protein EVAR_5755_1 [Eumeta japonica]|uniref:Uncharacterized protein n=1 Tax=Eumeta variegata TaxID=151549 RepID=A0A4C1T6Z1_EUMVA|nr:hypothetical protein EVAR_5755_1 [Eumeta japonica]